MVRPVPIFSPLFQPPKTKPELVTCFQNFTVLNYSFQIIQIPLLTNFRDVRQITKKIQQNIFKELYTIKMVAEKRTTQYGNFGTRGPANYTPKQ